MPGVPGIADDRLSLRGEKTRVPGLSDGPVIFLWSFVGLSMVFNGSDPQEWLVDVGLLKMEHTNLKWIMTWGSPISGNHHIPSLAKFNKGQMLTLRSHFLEIAR